MKPQHRHGASAHVALPRSTGGPATLGVLLFGGAVFARLWLGIDLLVFAFIITVWLFVISHQIPTLEVEDGALIVRTRWFGRKQWPVAEISEVFSSAGMVWIRVAGTPHAVTPPLTLQHADQLAAWLRATLAAPPSVEAPLPPPDPELRHAEDHDGLRLVVARNIPWVAVPAALLVALGAWIGILASTHIFLGGALVIAAFGAFLLLFSPELRPRTELRLTHERLTVRSGWLLQTERVWALSDITALRCEWRDVLLEVDGRTQKITRVTPEAARWLVSRFAAARRARIEAPPPAPPELVALIEQERRG